MKEPEIKNMLSNDNCILHTKELLGLINLDLQYGRTREAIEFIFDHIDNAKSKVFSIKELKDLMRHI